MSDYKNIMIYGEILENNLGTITLELLGAGRKLADERGEELHAVLMGENIGEIAGDVIAYGADKVFVIDNPSAREYQADLHVPVLQRLIDQNAPRIFLLGNTEIGQDLGPRLAFRLKTALVTDCISMSTSPDGNGLTLTKPVYGGKAMAEINCESFPQMAALRPKSSPPLERDDSRKGEIITLDMDFEPSQARTKTLKKVIEESEGIKLEDAEIIISGGRGIGSKEGFQKLEQLAGLFKNAAVGASRPACDSEWVSTKIQVGITGKIVAPKVYIAVGISGASQHLTGCSGSESIVAINNDESAPIFKVAKFGLVGDWNIALPAFTNRVAELLKE